MPRTRAFVGRHRTALSVLLGAASLLVAFLVVRELMGSGWPLDKANWLLVAAATVCYFLSYVFRAYGWRQLFCSSSRPTGARCLASVGAGAASGSVLPFHLGYAVKIGIFKRLGGGRCRIGLEAVMLSMLSLALVDGVALLPLSISAASTTDEASFRIPLALVAAAGLGSGVVLFGGRRLLAFERVRRYRALRWLADKAIHHVPLDRSTAAAWALLVAGWAVRAVGVAALLAALGVGFSMPVALAVITLSSLAAVLPLSAGGAVANVGATAAVLLALGVGKEQALAFSVASGMLLSGAALIAALVGGLASTAVLLGPRLKPALARVRA